MKIGVGQIEGVEELQGVADAQVFAGEIHM